MRRCYDAYSRGDLAAAGQAYSEDTVWDVSRFRPDEGVHTGIAELAKYLGSWRETWEEHSFSLEQVVDAGDLVVAVIREAGTGKASGTPVTIRYGQVIKVRDGKIVETVVYREVADAFDAAGVPAAAGTLGASMLEARVNGLRIAYQQAGDGFPLVLLHGLLSSHRAWILQTELSDEFTVVAWDAPGAGGFLRSAGVVRDGGLGRRARRVPGGARGRRRARARPLLGRCARTGALQPTPWTGALADPGDTYAGWKGSLPADECAERVMTSIEESQMPAEEVVRRWLPGLLSPSAPPELAREVGIGLSDFHPAGYRAMARAIGETDTRELLPTIDVPTLLLWGEADARSPLRIAEEMRDAIPGARLVVIAQRRPHQQHRAARRVQLGGAQVPAGATAERLVVVASRM